MIIDTTIKDRSATKWELLGILSALMALTSLSTDIYLPAMPVMQQSLHGNIELTIMGFLLGFSVAQIIWGPISDKFGRKRPLLIGLCLFVVGSIGCAVSEHIAQIVLWRMVQAFGACTAPMLSRAMIRDLYGRTKGAEMLSTLMVVMAIAPIGGPLLGGQILRVSSWHAIFWLLASIGVVMIFLTKWLPETYPQQERTNTSLAETFSSYKELLRNWGFMRYTLCVTFYYVGAYAFIAGSPFVYISYFHVDPQYYGLLFALNVVGLMLVSVFNRKLVNRYSLDTLLRVAVSIAMIASVIMAVFIFNEVGSIYAVVVLFFFFFAMNGIIAASAAAAALDNTPRYMTGAASALLGSLQYGSGVISILLLTAFADGTPWTMSWIIALFGVLATLVIFIEGNKKELP